MVRAVGIFFGCVTQETGGRGISLSHRGVFLKPNQVGIIRRNEGEVRAVARAAVARCFDGFCVTPAVSFDVSIGKREHARADVFDGGAMPEPTRVSHEKNESGVTQVQGRGVNERIELARIKRCRVRRLEKNVSVGAGLLIVAGELPAKIRIERVAADFLVNGSEDIWLGTVARALVNFRVLDISGKEALARIEETIQVGEELGMYMLAALDP